MSKHTASFVVDKAITDLSVSGQTTNKPTVATVSDSANDPTAEEYLSGYVDVTGGGADTITLPTGAVLTAAMQNPANGQSFTCFVKNDSGGTLTIAAGASGSIVEPIPLAALTVADTNLVKLEFVLTSASTYVALLYTGTAAT